MVEVSTIIFNIATAYLKALIVAVKKVDNNKQSNSSNSKMLDKDVGIDIGNVVQSIK